MAEKLPATREGRRTASRAPGAWARHLRTGDLPRAGRLAAWSNVLRDTIGAVEVDPLTADGIRFRAEATVYRLIGLGAVRGTTVRARLTHPATAPDDGLCLITGPMPAWHASQGGHTLSLGAGDGVLVSNAAPWTIVLPRETPFVAVRVPTAALAGTGPGAHPARRIPADSIALRLLTDYIGMLPDGPASTAALLDAIVATHVHALLAAALSAASDAPAPGQGGTRTERLRAVLAQINAHFADPDFSAAIVAKRLGVSVRYVQDLLHDTGTSFTERVLALRLEKARTMLQGTRPRKIIDIALACGFGDVSYFNRRFRGRFGVSPSRFRDER
jgi:AraC-like DNA-binding protein